MQKKRKILIISLMLISLMLASGFYFFTPGAYSDVEKEYRHGQIVYISGKDYVVASNKSFVEILEITPDDKLVQVSEVHGMDQVRDMHVYRYEKSTFLIVASSRYLLKYDITNPLLPKILLERDIYEWHNWGLEEGRGVVGSIYFLTGNNDYIFALGSKGVRSFVKDNLFHYKIYTQEKVYGIAVDENNLYALMDGKGQVFNIETGEMIAEYKNIINSAPETRRPFIDYQGNVYSLTDNGLVKSTGNSEQRYYSPTEVGVMFSYAVKGLPSGEVFYANGYGLAKFDKNFQKQGFLFSANGYKYGTGSWALSVDAANVDQGDRVALFNKSSIMFLDKNMNLLFQYKYTPSSFYTKDNITTELKIVPSKYAGSPNTAVVLDLFGFWPNESVSVDFGTHSYSANTDNLGYARAEMVVPTTVPEGTIGGIIVINAMGDDSGLRYQTTFRME